jgi:hypothetical protein
VSAIPALNSSYRAGGRTSARCRTQASVRDGSSRHATYICCGNYTTANAQSDETVAVADEKGAVQWKVRGTLNRGCVLALTGKASDAVQTITSGIAALRSTGATVWLPLYLSYLARAYAELGQFDDARRSISEAMMAVETTKYRAGGNAEGRIVRRCLHDDYEQRKNAGSNDRRRHRQLTTERWSRFGLRRLLNRLCRHNRRCHRRHQRKRRKTADHHRSFDLAPSL